MKKETMPIEEIIMNVADGIFTAGPDDSPTTIRCCINDALDYWEREGYRVNHNYDQTRAIQRVKARIRALETECGRD